MITKGILFVIAAPSGTGKTTLVSALIERVSQQCLLEKVITYTSKTPRINEVCGIDYHFISENEFKIKIEQQFFLEWSDVYGAYYGCSKEILAQIEQGRSYILILDRKGAKSVKESYPNAVLIWLIPPSLEELAQRLHKRATDLPEHINRRLDLAHVELEQERSEKLFDYVIINKDFNTALAQLEELVVRSIEVYKKNRS